MHSKNIITICYISYREPFEVVLKNFSRALSKHPEFNILHLGIDNGISNENEYINNSNYIDLQVSKYSNKKLKILFFILNVCKYLRANNISIVHLDISCPYFSLIKFLSFSKSKYVFHILSYPVTNSSISRIKKKLSIFFQCLYMDSIIVQSAEIKNRWFGIKLLNKAKVIPVGFDKSLFYPLQDHEKKIVRNDLEISDEETVIVFSGVLSKHRKLEVLIESISIIKKHNNNIKLLIIGDGSELNNLKILTKSLGLNDTVLFTGHVDHDDVFKYLGASDIAISYVPVNESYKYNPPLKTFEYLGCGLPTIATNTLSNENIIQDGYNGVLTKDVPEEIAEKILALLENSNLMKELSKNARESVLNYDYSYLTNKHIKPLYKSLIYNN